MDEPESLCSETLSEIEVAEDALGCIEVSILSLSCTLYFFSPLLNLPVFFLGFLDQSSVKVASHCSKLPEADSFDRGKGEMYVCL